MRKFDYSFLNKGRINGSLINVLTTIYSMKSIDELRKGNFPNVYTELQKIAIVQSVKSSNAIENPCYSHNVDVKLYYFVTF